MIDKWKRDADAVGIDLNTIITRWEHTKGLYDAFLKSKKAKEHSEAVYLAHFIVPGVIESVVIGVRRQVDADKNSVSLINLLEELKANPAIYALDECKKTFVERAGVWGLDKSRYEVDAQSAYARVSGSCGTEMDPDVIEKDIAELKALSDALRTVANKHIAHKDRRAKDFDLNWSDLDDILHKIWDISRKYTRLFDGGAHGKVTADPDSMRSFYEFAWIKPEPKA